MLATRYGLAAIDMVHKGEFGRLVVLHGTKIESIPLEEAISKNRTLDASYFEIIDSLELKI
jgi:6-phosphofructokinase 1